MKVLISARTLVDIDSIYKYSSQFSLVYANKVIKNLYSTIFYLELSPYLGRYVPEISNKNYLEVFYKNYRIVYSVYKKLNIVYIHFIVHAKRNFQLIYNSYINENLNIT